MEKQEKKAYRTMREIESVCGALYATLVESGVHRSQPDSLQHAARLFDEIADRATARARKLKLALMKGE